MATPTKPAPTPAPTPASSLATFDVEGQAVATLGGKIFRATAVITPSAFRITALARKSGGELWPMSSEDALEYSAIVAATAERAVLIQRELKGLSL